MPPFSAPGILVLPKESKRIGRHKTQSQRPDVPSSSSDTAPASPGGGRHHLSPRGRNRSPPPLPALLPLPPAALFRGAVPETPKRSLHRNRGDPLSLSCWLLPRPLRHPLPHKGRGVTPARLLYGLLSPRYRGREGVGGKQQSPAL